MKLTPETRDVGVTSAGAGGSEQIILTKILDGLSEPVIACDAVGSLTYMNSSARDLSPVATAAREPLNWAERYRMLQPDGITTLSLAETPWHRALQGETVRGFELVIAPPKAPPRLMFANASPLMDHSGQVSGAVIILHDAVVRESDLKLRQSQKMEAIGQVAGGVAHDFNNMLTAIMSFGQFALDGLATDSPVRVDIEEIMHAGEKAASLTRQLLAFGRRQLLQPRALDLNAVIGSSENLIRRVIGADIEIVIRRSAAPSVVHVDPVQLELVLLNLAINARDAMPTGGRLVIESSHVELDAAAAATLPGIAEGPVAMLTVSDTGAGMDRATCERIFEPFFTTKGVGKGTGLGLSTAYGVVRQSGGAISVHSEVGKGTTFRVYLPRSDAPETDLLQTPVPWETSGSETVLLAEDEDAVRAVVRRVLAGRGYTVLEASNGEEALALAHRYTGKIDLLLSDMIMPRIGGFELASQLALDRPDLRVVLMSGYTETHVTRNADLEKRICFLEKPFTVDQLAAVVRLTLDNKICH